MTETDDQAARTATASAGPRATAAIATHESWAVALETALGRVMTPGDATPDVLLVFASPAWGASLSQLVEAARQRTGAGILLGCAASGVLAGHQEIGDLPGLALMAWWLPGARLYPLRLHQEHVELLGDPDTWHDVHGIPPEDVRSWLVFAEPYRIDTRELVRGLQALYPQATIVGGMASGMIAERTSCVFLDGHVYTEGGVALGIGGRYALNAHVSQGCDPIGEPWTITAVDHNSLVAISGRPAFDVLQDALLGLAPGRRERAQRHLVVGLANNEYLDQYGRGDFLIRGILGIDARRGSIAIGGSPRVGQTIQFHLRETASAEADLTRMLERARENAAPVVAAVLCTCDGRGQALFDKPGHDARAVHDALPGVPLAGASFIGEIGPLGRRAELHGFTATLAVLHHDGAP